MHRRHPTVGCSGTFKHGCRHGHGAAQPALPAGTLMAPDCSRWIEATILMNGADIGRASHLVDQMGAHFRDLCADHTVSAMWPEHGPGADQWQLKCFVCLPGPVAMGEMERGLRAEILKRDTMCSSGSVRVKARPISDAHFATRGDQILDSACRLAVHYTHAPAGGDNARRTNGAKRRRGPAAPDTAAQPPPDASQSPPLAGASFAAVVADLPQAAFSIFAAAASEKHAELKASFRPPHGPCQGSRGCDGGPGPAGRSDADSGRPRPFRGRRVSAGGGFGDGRGASGGNARGPARFASRK